MAKSRCSSSARLLAADAGTESALLPRRNAQRRALDEDVISLDVP